MLFGGEVRLWIVNMRMERPTAIWV